jgi:hypothetical protein
MGLKYRYSNATYVGTLAEFMASTRKFKLGDKLMPSDSEEIRIANGVDVFEDLMSLPVAKADNIAAIGATTNLTALAVTPAAATASAAVLSTSNTYTDAAVKTSIDGAVDALKGKVLTALDLKADNADVETLRGQVETRLDGVEAKFDALVAALVAAGLMVAPEA